MYRTNENKELFKITYTSFAKLLLQLSRTRKRIVVFLVDIIICEISVWLSFFLRLGTFVPISAEDQWSAGLRIAMALTFAVSALILPISGIYNTAFRFIHSSNYLRIAFVFSGISVLFTALVVVLDISGIPKTVGAIQAIISVMLVILVRVVARLILDDEFKIRSNKSGRQRALIYGTGSRSRNLAEELKRNPDVNVIGFLDDDDRIENATLRGLKVYNTDAIIEVIQRVQVTHIFIVAEDVSRESRSRLVNLVTGRQVVIRILPTLAELTGEEKDVAKLRQIDIHDLLGREPVKISDGPAVERNKGKVVLITGAGGSIGSEICRQVATLGVNKLILLDHSEFALYKIFEEMKTRRKGESILEIVPILASVRERSSIEDIFQNHRPDTVYHAAAYKHVPIVEGNIFEGIKNNVFGTLYVAQASMKFGVSSVILISTDKAVRPLNVMGMTKRLAEMIFQAMDPHSRKTRFSIVRFGNVLGSSGSVVPKFADQISHGGPVTVTHSEVTRYFMTISEAAELVIEAGGMAEGGEVFILDMGTPVKIVDLARKMIELSGFRVKESGSTLGDIELLFIGLRPGEKLHEELVVGDTLEPTRHPRIMKAPEEHVLLDELTVAIEAMRRQIDEGNLPCVLGNLRDLVSPCPAER